MALAKSAARARHCQKQPRSTPASLSGDLKCRNHAPWGSELSPPCSVSAPENGGPLRSEREVVEPGVPGSRVPQKRSPRGHRSPGSLPRGKLPLASLSTAGYSARLALGRTTAPEQPEIWETLAKRCGPMAGHSKVSGYRHVWHRGTLCTTRVLFRGWRGPREGRGERGLPGPRGQSSTGPGADPSCLTPAVPARAAAADTPALLSAPGVAGRGRPADALLPPLAPALLQAGVPRGRGAAHLGGLLGSLPGEPGPGAAGRGAETMSPSAVAVPDPALEDGRLPR